MDQGLTFGVLYTGELSFSSENMSCLDDMSPALSPFCLRSDVSNDELEDLINSKTDANQCLAEEASQSSIIMTAAVMAGSAVVMASQPKKKNRASGFHTQLFSNPVSFNMVSEFYGPDMFRKSFRMSRTTFLLLLDTVGDLVYRRFVAATDYRRETVPGDIRLAITLRVLAGASYCDLSLAYQVKESTVFDIFASTCDALNQRLCFEGFPKTELALQHIAQGFQTSRPDSSPVFGCVGALDGICIKIKKPAAGELPASFYSRKGFYALPVQALCDSNYIFRYCSVVCTGATHDALAYAVSGLKKDIDDGILGDRFYIVGDEAYTCTEQLITPFSRGTSDFDRMNFNFFVSSMRIHIEQAFGMLVARWRILKGGLDYSVSRCTDIVCLLMKLHNFCVEYDGPESAGYGLTQQEKEELDEDIKAWYRQSDELAKEFHPGSRGTSTIISGSRRSSISRTKRDALVAIVKDKNRRRPNPVPLAIASYS